MVHVVEWDKPRQRVVFMLDDYEHPCLSPSNNSKNITQKLSKVAV
ncbi:hypothetical protein [Providencia huaxiensis]